MASLKFSSNKPILWDLGGFAYSPNAAFNLTWHQSHPSKKRGTRSQFFSPQQGFTAESLFQLSFDSDTYKKRKCSKNIYRLLQIFNSNEVDISKSSVLILPNIRMYGVRSDHRSTHAGTPFEGNPHLESLWNYHVVLVHDGYVYDFDHTNQPIPLPLDLYMEVAFLPAWEDIDVDPSETTATDEIIKIAGNSYIESMDRVSALTVFLSRIPAVDLAVNDLFGSPSQLPEGWVTTTLFDELVEFLDQQEGP